MQFLTRAIFLKTWLLLITSPQVMVKYFRIQACVVLRYVVVVVVVAANIGLEYTKRVSESVTLLS